MHLLVHSPWLPGYINVAQTVLVILTKPGIFLDECCINTIKYYTAIKEESEVGKMAEE